MSLFRKAGAGNKFITIAALVVSVLAVWRAPIALGLPKDSLLFAGHGLSIVWAAALFLLFRHAFSCNDVRLKRAAYGVGLCFSFFTLVGKQLESVGELAPFQWSSVLSGLFMLPLFGLVYGSALLLLYQWAESIFHRARAARKESSFSRVTGNGLVVFLFLMLCWLPVWLAFWPGTFGLDSVTQFYTYLDGIHNTHHPLLHTLLLGACMMLGIDNSADGSAAIGLAIYCLVQMILLAAMLAYACHWLRRRAAPLSARVFVTLLFALFPFYAIWSFSAQKDILFGGLVLMFVLELADLWRDGFAALRSPLRILKFALIAALMMLIRNNGIYALCLFLPFALLWAKGARLRVTVLFAGCAAAYFLANGVLIWATEATVPSKIELLSIPLQQIARTLRDNPDSMAEDHDRVLEALYDFNPAEIYVPAVADPVKWAAHDGEVDENLPQLLSLWFRMGVHNIKPYLEAFLEQNLPYYLPGAEMLYRLDLGVIQIDIFPIEEHSFFPALRKPYEEYDQTLTLFGLPGVRLLSDTAFQVWLCIAGLGLAWYRREKQFITGFAFLLAIWFTCLIGPVAIIRYLLGFFYTVPVMLAALLAPQGNRGPTITGGESPVPLGPGQKTSPAP